MKNIRLYVSIFKDSAEETNKNPIVPVSAGAALYGKNDKKAALCDNTGENISEENPQYCELTVQYWAWKNQSFDIGGLMHQRRYFDLSDTSPYAFDQPEKPKRPYRIFDEPSQTLLQNIGLTNDHITSLMNRYRIIAPLSENLYQSVESYYNKNDRQDYDDLALVRDIIKALYPAYSDSAEKYLSGNYAYFCNMFIADKAVFCDYSEWLFTILSEYTKQKPSEMHYPREQGKIAERLFGIYMTHLKDNTDIPWAEMPRAHFSSVNGTTTKNMSFNKLWYRLCPPNSIRRGIVRKIIHK